VTSDILAFVHDVMGSPWIYLVLFVLAMLDGFIPAFPSETVVITAGAFAASGSPEVPLVIAVSAAGAFVGDHLSYLIGRTAGARLLARARPGTRRRRAFDRTAAMLASRGGLTLVVARYIPGGRTAVTVTMGAIGFPLRRFTFFDAVAAVTWGVYSTLVGYVGGLAFEREPLKGVALGLGLAIGITAVVEVIRHLRSRRTAWTRRIAAAGEPNRADAVSSAPGRPASAGTAGSVVHPRPAPAQAADHPGTCPAPGRTNR
jgi:membrane-associated protein